VPLAWAGYAWGSHLLTLGSLWRGSRARPLATLTFDDGPDPETTPRVLDALAEHGVRGAFFLIGRRAAAYPGVVRRIAAEGHDVGNHTWSHRSLWLCGPRATRREVLDGHDAIAQAAGQPPRYFRAPWGMTNLAMFPLLGPLATPCVFWSVQPEGRRPAEPAQQVARCARRAGPGAIVDLHDADGVPGAGARLTGALPGIVDALRGQGLTLVPLRDLL
jgi:peptidoglycan/xylan/chitin deacetylase (PgdA/CDA1 family)